jgi:hypothetical protein
MKSPQILKQTFLVAVVIAASAALLLGQPPRQPAQPKAAQPPPGSQPPGARDAVAEAQTPRRAEAKRPEQRLTDQDRPERFSAKTATPSSPVFKDQPKEGRITGFDFFRDPLGADHPGMTLQEVMQNESAGKPRVAAAQRQLLESRYDLTPHPDPNLKMSRGKPVLVGPTARLARGMSWEALGQMSPDQIRRQNVFPYPSLPHPLQVNGGQVFPKMQIEMFPRLARFDVDFDLPEEFLPEFPPAIFLNNRPELGDVSRLPRQRAHHGAVPPEPGRPAARAPFPARHGEPPRRVPSTNPRQQAEPPVGRRFHRVRAADGVFQW